MKLSSRIGIVAFTLGSCALAAFLRFQETDPTREPAPFELFDAIQTQLLALRSQRYQAAYLQASSRYMDSHGLDGFIETARGDNAAIRQALRWEFGFVADRGEETAVDVRFFLPSGQSLSATYTVVRENREWKIDHVWFAPPSQPRAVAGLRL
ncbi:MAG: protein of unknown function (DUF4864) [Verrucomicrobia bacterium]|nr:MAG: protein of unknown function (DUF4864) [Verrucomicrobiota bacterium]